MRLFFAAYLTRYMLFTTSTKCIPLKITTLYFNSFRGKRMRNLKDELYSISNKKINKHPK